MDWANIIVITLTILLVIALIVTAVLAVMFIRVTKRIKQLNGSTRNTARTVIDAVQKADVGKKLAIVSALAIKRIKKRRKSDDEVA